MIRSSGLKQLFDQCFLLFYSKIDVSTLLLIMERKKFHEFISIVICVSKRFTEYMYNNTMYFNLCLSEECIIYGIHTKLTLNLCEIPIYM